jgi:hypothetical protein
MNRLKLWLYMVILLGAGAWNIYRLSQALTERSLAQVNQSLSAANAQLEARTLVLARSVAALAGIASRHPDLRQAIEPAAPAPSKPAARLRGRAAAKPALHPAAEAPAGGVASAGAVAAARAALETASAEANVDLSRAFGFLVGKDGKAVELMGPAGLDEPLADYVQQAPGTTRQQYVQLGKGLWYVASVPVGSGASLIVGLPLDEAWALEVKQAAGVEVILTSGGKELLKTLPARDATTVLDALQKHKPGTPADAGMFLPASLLQKLHKSLPTVPLLFVKSAPAYRAQTMAVPGVPNALVVVARSTQRAFEPIAHYQQLYLAGLVAALLLGLIVGIFVRTDEAPLVPKSLLTAAEKIARGQFETRVPEMAGKLGAVADALNRATAAASANAAAAGEPMLSPSSVVPIGGQEPLPGSQPLDSTAPDFFGHPDAGLALGRSPPDAEPSSPADPFNFGAPPAPAAPAQSETAFSGPLFSAPGDLMQQASRAAPPAAAPTHGFSPPPAAKAEPPPPPPPPPAETWDDEDVHWHHVFDEFMRVREECGEASEGLTFDRFRLKLEKNRDQLVQKYNCKTVRFQVYVKEGRAALKATPVK